MRSFSSALLRKYAALFIIEGGPPAGHDWFITAIMSLVLFAIGQPKNPSKTIWQPMNDDPVRRV
jgi:hypothetical protein